MEKTILTEYSSETEEVLRGVRLLNPSSGFDGVVDVALGGGIVRLIQPSAGPASGLWLVPGLVDMHVHLRTPGYEDAETLETGLRAAVAGGVTVVGMMPNTTPPLDSPDVVLPLVRRAESLGLASVCPIPAVTEGRFGVRCNDFQSFADSGVTCFSDDGSPVFDDGVLLTALTGVVPFDGLVIEHPEIVSLAAGGAVNKGEASEKTGVGGIPERAEYLDVERCIEVLRRSETAARLHLTHLSSPHSIRLVHQASLEGLNVTCDVTPHHLALNERAVMEMGTTAKMNPPLRSEESRKDLVRMVGGGMVNAVASDHAPHTEAGKTLPLETAAFGVTGLETLFPVTLKVLQREAGMEPIDIVRLLTTAPAGILGVREPDVSAGLPLNMFLFDPKQRWVYDSSFSMSVNSPFFGKEITGKVLRVWYGREVYRGGEFV